MIFRKMAEIAGHDYPESEDEAPDAAHDDACENGEEGEEEEEEGEDDPELRVEVETSEVAEVEVAPTRRKNKGMGCEDDEVRGPAKRSAEKLQPTPRHPSPSEQHDAIRPSPTAEPSGLQAKRALLQAKLAAIQRLKDALHIGCLGHAVSLESFVYIYIHIICRDSFDILSTYCSVRNCRCMITHNLSSAIFSSD